VNSVKAHERFGELIDFDYPWHPIFGVIRASSLKMTSLMGNYVGSDRNLLAEIGLIGRIYIIPEYLFFERKHSDQYSNRIKKLPSTQKRLTWWDPKKTMRITFTYNCIEYFRSVRRIPLKWTERLLCYAQIVKWFLRRGWMLIVLDVERGLLLRSSFGRKFDSAAKALKRKAQERLGGIT